MRRSICLSHPMSTHAGTTSNWTFKYTPAATLPEGAKLKFDMLCPETHIEWQHPSTDFKMKKNIIWALHPDGTELQAERGLDESTFSSTYEFTLHEKLKAGDTFEIHMGTRKGDPLKDGTRTQLSTKRRRPFHLWIDPKGKGDYKEHEIFTIDIKGSKLRHLEVIAPTLVSRNKRFNILVRFEDEYGNLTGNAPEETMIDFYYQGQRESLKRQYLVPETGYITIPNIYFTAPGTYRLEFTNLLTEQKFVSAPVHCEAVGDQATYWGLFHGESHKVDPIEDIEATLRHFRDEKAYHFYSASPLDDADETPSEAWKRMQAHAADFNEEDRFSSLLAFQYLGEPTTEGSRIVVYAKDNKPIMRRKEAKSANLKQIYDGNTSKEFISIPAFTMGKNCPYDFKEHSSELERLVEIYNAWGSSECTEKEGNLRPIKGKVKEAKEGSIRAALKANCRFGFVAGGLDDRGIYQDLYDSGQEQYSPGLTAIISSEEHTRETLWQAMMQRRTYASTGAKMAIDFKLAGAMMGDELCVSDKPGLKINRHLTARIAGTDAIKSVEIIRNSEVIHTFKPSKDGVEEEDTYECETSQEGQTFTFAYDDMTPMSKVALKCPKGGSDFVYYYLRIVQADDEIAWVSPIWVDLTKPTPVDEE